MTNRRKFIQSCATVAAAGLVAGCTGSGNGEYPHDEFTLINPYPPGGGTDAYFSQFVDPLSEELGVDVSQDYVSGAAGANGTRELYQEDDPHVIGNINLPAFVMLEWELDNPGYDINDLTPLTSFATAATMIIAQPGEFDDIHDMIDQYQNGDISSIAGEVEGGRVHMTAWTMKERWGLDYSEYVGYDGGGETVSAVLGGDVPVGVIGVTPTVPYIEEDELDGVVVGAEEPRDAIPDVPTTEDEGLDSVDDISVYSRNFFGNPEMGDEEQEVVTDALINVLESDAVQDWSSESGNPIVSDGSDPLQGRVDESYDLQSDWEEFMDAI